MQHSYRVYLEEMWRVDLSCLAGEEEMALAGFVGFDIAAADTGEGHARAWFASEQEALQCAAALNGSVHEQPEENWNAAWQAEWTASAAGERFWLAPPWDEGPTPPDRMRLNMHPGTLFGNGDHPTTRLCLAALERHVTPGCTVVDVGCGSGLLLEAARMLGAGVAVGCDLDFGAAKTAPCAFQGSVDAVASHSVDVLVANIQIAVLQDLLPEFERVLRSNGTLILSGILEEQMADLPRHGTWTVGDDWACLVSSAGSGGSR